ncbi:MAG: phytase [Pseudomonadota bacterium]
MSRFILGLFVFLVSIAGVFWAALWVIGSPTPLGGAARCYMAETFYDLSFESPPDYAVTVDASQETEPVLDRCDAADDPAIWVNESAPSASLVLGTNKQRSLNVYDLDGALLSRRRIMWIFERT